jgi:hypothetical protein
MVGRKAYFHITGEEVVSPPHHPECPLIKAVKDATAEDQDQGHLPDVILSVA